MNAAAVSEGDKTMRSFHASKNRHGGKPPLKVSQGNQALCEIVSVEPVDYRELQGYLPPFNPMQVQEINSLAQLASETATLPDPSQERACSNCIPMSWLRQFDRVDSQFSSLQVWFESAIALYPSNPKFQADLSPVALMPTQQGRSLKATLGSCITKIEVTLTGDQSIMLSILDNEGHCVASTQTETKPRSNHQDLDQYEPQKIVLETKGSKHLRIDSRAPFIITHFAVVYS